MTHTSTASIHSHYIQLLLSEAATHFTQLNFTPILRCKHLLPLTKIQIHDARSFNHSLSNK